MQLNVKELIPFNAHASSKTLNPIQGEVEETLALMFMASRQGLGNILLACQYEWSAIRALAKFSHLTL